MIYFQFFSEALVVRLKGLLYMTQPSYSTGGTVLGVFLLLAEI
jgi:hypothetical protein